VSTSRDIQITFKSKWLFVIAGSGIIAVIVFCVFYLFADYNFLSEWYLKMNDCFYRHAQWKQDFFTIDTKKLGNICCITGLAICLPLQYHLIKRLKKGNALLKVQFSKADVLILFFCILIGAAAWVWGNSLVHPGFDEAFSAVNCASLPPFQTLSYYMLPNNHILFNILNGLLFHFAGDKVFTGKLISLACFAGIVVIVFAWVSGIIRNKLLVAIATIVVCFQFPIWGFGFEARGYELYSLAEWFSFFTLIKYINSRDSQWLYYYALACITGYWCIPSFLYFHIAFMFFGLFCIAYTKATDIKFWAAQFSIILITFLLYLPGICFSGIHALTGNQYVTAKIHGPHEFYLKSINMFTRYLDYYSSNFIASDHSIDIILFLLPLILFCFYRNRLAVLCGFFYMAMWITCIGLAYVMKVYPLDRSMSGQISISFALTIYGLYLSLLKLNGLLKRPVFADAVLALFLLVLGIHIGIRNQQNVSAKLYNNDINSKYDQLIQQGINFIPKGKTIAFSDECFYWYYLCMNRGDKVSKCMSGNEQYFIRFNTDPFPVSDSDKYVPAKKVLNYEIYKRLDISP
jgi:hypothetical protein